MPIAYCSECDWERRIDDEASAELNQAMIDHYVETGHSVEQRAESDERRVDREPEL
ncbi:hypothetical protein [Natronococcus pandeyae]|uniref:hypothetical protein n=1 Tax=Natronococcus pandeyae TaxID=2055836 RepID=UPI0016531250|nr:hypothetical protein [Natronococcus pandeyae]